MSLAATAPLSAPDVERTPGPETTPRVRVTAQGGRSGRTEAVDVPADIDGIQHLVDWLSGHEGWVLLNAEVTP